MVVNIQRGWLSPGNKWGCTIALKVNSIANSSSGAPRGGTGARQGSQWENGAGWMLGEGVRGGGQIECLCAGLIMLWTEWAHITKDLLSVAGELLQSGNSAQPFSLPAARNMWPSSASVGRFKQQQTLCWSRSPSAYKAASVSEGGKSEGRLPLTGSRSAVPLSISNFSPPDTPSSLRVIEKRTGLSIMGLHYHCTEISFWLWADKNLILN